MAVFDLILQNNASKELFLITGLTNVSASNTSVKFTGVEMPDGMQDGEYSYYCVRNDRNDVEYSLNSVPLKTTVSCSGNTYTLEELRPMTGLMRVGEIKTVGSYRKNNETFYYKK